MAIGVVKFELPCVLITPPLSTICVTLPTMALVGLTPPAPTVRVPPLTTIVPVRPVLLPSSVRFPPPPMVRPLAVIAPDRVGVQPPATVTINSPLSGLVEGTVKFALDVLELFKIRPPLPSVTVAPLMAPVVARAQTLALEPRAVAPR